MERDCVISHGMSEMLKERLFTVSDKFRVHVCSLCGLMAIAKMNDGKYACGNCRTVKYLIFRVNISSKHKFPMQPSC